MASITLPQALGLLKRYIFGGTPKNTDQDALKPAGIPCPSCEHPLRLVRPLHAEFLKVDIYQCPNCGLLKEIQSDTEGNLQKEIIVYNYTSNTSDFVEILGLMNYSQFSLNHLWEVCGRLCFPALIKTEFSTDVELFFIPVEDNLSYNAITGFIYTQNGILARTQIKKTNDMSYFVNPYISKLPHSTFLYATLPLITNATTIGSVEPIRYRHKISDHNAFQIEHELYIIEDFPVFCFGIELYVKAITMNKNNYTIRQLLDIFDVSSIILCKEEHVPKEGFYICNSRISKLNLFALGNRDISDEQKESFLNDIYNFFDTAIGG
jgi:ssDNA-binding Zn-finger/Zn-ribbon topoisomerase 1